MTKTVKRIIAVVLLLVTVLLIGYSCYTGSRLASYPQKLDGYLNATFRTKQGGILSFTDEYAWYQTEGEEVVLLTVESYENGIITMLRDEVE